MQEAEINGGLEHPGIVPVYGSGQYADGRPFYAMRFIRGDSLAEAIERFHGERPPRGAYEAVKFRKLLGRFVDVCNAVEYAHSRGVIHRDLKPQNVMLGKYGETLVVDWGLAKAQGRHDDQPTAVEHTLFPRTSSGSSATQYGAAIGTPAYMSPEQAAGRLDEIGRASDVYSLGATLYEIITGSIPFDREDVGAVLKKIQAGDFPRPRSVVPCVPPPLESICLKAMATEARDRYSSPQALAEDVERWLADETVAAHVEPPLARVRRWIRKHPRVDAAIAATLLVGITFAATTSTLMAGKNQQLAEANSELTSSHASERAAPWRPTRGGRKRSKRKPAWQPPTPSCGPRSSPRGAFAIKPRKQSSNMRTKRWLIMSPSLAPIPPPRPKSAEACNEIAWLRATCPDRQFRDGRRAVEIATTACELTGWQNAAYLDTLAAAYAELSDFPIAIEWQTKAVAAAPDEFRGLWRYRLELYQAGSSYQDASLTPKKKCTAPPDSATSD